MSETQWYWCLVHARVEAGDDRDNPDQSLGPYATEAAARDWKATNEARTESWKDQDKAWDGDDDEDRDDG